MVNPDDKVVNVVEIIDPNDVPLFHLETGFSLIKDRDWDPVPQPPPIPMVVETISDRQFFQQLAIMGVITQADALAAVKTGTIPASLQTYIDTLPADQQFSAEMHISGSVTFARHHPITIQLAQGMSWTDEQVDTLWTAASAL